MRSRWVLPFVILAACVVLLALRAQVTPPLYPYAKPRPTAGNTSNDMIRMSQTVAPSAHANEKPLLWAVDVAGGLQSRLNSVDRLAVNPNWNVEGSIVYDASDGIFYGVGTNLYATIPLFSLRSPPLNRPTIYLGDGTITNNRTVSGAGNNLSFTNIGAFGAYGLTSSISGASNLYVITPGVKAGNIATGLSLTLVDTSGRVEFQNAAGTPNNIYNSDGTLTSDRTLQGAGRRLTFTNFGLYETRGIVTNITGASTEYQLRLPTVVNGSASNTHVVTLIDKTTGKIDFAPLPAAAASVNIYNANGTIVTTDGARNVQLDTNTLYFHGASGTFFLNSIGRAYIISRTNTLYANDSWVGGTIGTNSRVQMATAKSASGTATNGHVFTLIDASTSLAEWNPQSNLYNNNGSLQSDRTVTLNGKTLSFTGASANSEYVKILNAGRIDLNAKTNISYSSEESAIATSPTGRLKIGTPLGPTKAANSVLNLIDPANGVVEWNAPNNIYNNDGTLATDRTVTGANRDFKVVGAKVASLDGGQVGLYARTNLYLSTPRVAAGTATANWVLTLTNAATGGAEFAPVPTALNIYNTNGTLTGNRDLYGGGFNLNFWGNSQTTTFPADYWHAYGWDRFIMNARTNEVRAAENWLWVAPKKITPQTQRVNAVGAANMNGQVFTFASSDGTADFQLPNNLYNNNGTLLANRTITGDGKSLTATGLLDSTVVATNVNLSANTTFTLKTVKVNNAQASVGHVLTLQDATSGRVEFAPMPAPPGSVNIYNQDGILTTARKLTSGGFNLEFWGQGAPPTEYLHFYNWDRYIVNCRTNELRSSENLLLRAFKKITMETPRVIANGAATMGGQIFTLAADGTADFQPFTPVGTDRSIYTHSDSLQADRTVTMNGKFLYFTGANANTELFQVYNVPRINLYSKTNFFYASEEAALASGTTRLKIGRVDTPSRSIGMVLTLTDPASSSVDYQLPNNLYNNSGPLTSDRLITGNGFSLSANTLRDWNFVTTNLNFWAYTTFALKTPRTITGNTQGGWVLALTNALTGAAEFMPIYDKQLGTDDQTLTGFRNVYGGGNSLVMSGINTLDMRATSVSLEAAATGGSMKIRTPKVTGGTAALGQVLTLNADLTAEFATVPSAVNFYNSGGTLIGPSPREVNANGYPIRFWNTPSWAIQSTGDLELKATGNFYFKTPQVNAPETLLPGPLYLKLKNSSTGYCDFEPFDTSGIATIYSQDGTIIGAASTRTVTLNNKTVNFQGPGNVTALGVTSFNVTSPVLNHSSILLDDDNLNLRAWTSLRVQTSKVAKSDPTLKAKQVLTLQSTANGLAEWESVTQSSGMIEYYGTGKCPQNTAPYTFTVGTTAALPAVDEETPDFIWDNVDYPDFTRLTFRADFTGTATQNDTGEVKVILGGGLARNVRLFGGGISPPAPGDIRERGMIELIYDAQQDQWIMLNFGIAGHTFMADAETMIRQARVTSTNAVTAKVTVVSFAGVVDVFADLADVPLTFKKVSTLGMATAGDGLHGDFFLTAYDPAAEGMQSGIDSTKMWKRLGVR